MKTEQYKWIEDWDRGTVLMSVWGDEHEDHSEDFWLPAAVTATEIKRLEELGPGMRSDIYITKLRLKYKSK